ncbi:MAG TPA: MTAP family purine nucleoside phosphorylase [Syntrophales bacterium]|nr:MTAP family purine nucleoside phosphorylase [Syntrophales bacterium]
MEPLGIISGTMGMGKALGKLELLQAENEFGTASVMAGKGICYIPRHGTEPSGYILPHRINHPANLKALRDNGVREIIGVNSTGSLKRHLGPGTVLVPDDFISIVSGATVYKFEPVHITPELSGKVRRKLLNAAAACGAAATDGGVYWQTRGPRLETAAEIRFMAQYADVVGMTMASEAVVAQELGMEYASLCSVDNYANGLVEKPLSMEEILENARRNQDVIRKIIIACIEGRG